MPAFPPGARISPAAAAQKYGDAQGNPPKGYGRQFSTLLFVEFTDAAHARTWVSQLRAGLSTGPSAATDMVSITSTARAAGHRSPSRWRARRRRSGRGATYLLII